MLNKTRQILILILQATILGVTFYNNPDVFWLVVWVSIFSFNIPLFFKENPTYKTQTIVIIVVVFLYYFNVLSSMAQLVPLKYLVMSTVLGWSVKIRDLQILGKDKRFVEAKNVLSENLHVQSANKVVETAEEFVGEVVEKIKGKPGPKIDMELVVKVQAMWHEGQMNGKSNKEIYIEIKRALCVSKTTVNRYLEIKIPNTN